MLRTLLAWLLFAGICFGQTPVALHTSDPKFTPRWVDVPAPSLPLAVQPRQAGYTSGSRTPGSYEVAYALVDEAWAISPVSAPVVINPVTSDWDIVGTTPNVPMWTRATGVLWVWREAGTQTWKSLGVDENRGLLSSALKPFKAVAGWQHRSGGHWLYASSFPGLDNIAFYPASVELAASPPAPAVRLLECPNQSYEVAYSWACNRDETALSPIASVLVVANAAANRHAPIVALRTMPSNPQQPPQGALGMYVYLRKAGGPWHRQPCPDGLTGDLWALDCVTLRINQFVESGIAPGVTTGKSYLSSLHLALRDWNRDIIVDNDQLIYCPLVSEYNGATWIYQPQNQWIASYSTTTAAGTWTLTVDGVTSAPMNRTANFNNAWQQWQPTLDAAFGAGNVTISDFWALYAPKIELTGKWAATNMTGKISVEVKDANGVVVNPGIVGSQVGQGWVMSVADAKFKRKISTSNAGNWRVQDTATTPDGVTGYPMGWPLWVECSQRTKLVGCDFLLAQSNCGIATVDNSGGGCFHFNPVECSVAPVLGNSRDVTFGLRCIDSSSYGWNNHICSEMIVEKCHFQAKFPIVMEGVQAANWQVRDTTCFSNGTFDSAIITASNAGTLYLGGRFTCDNARTLIASVWCKKVTIENIWIDGGMPSLLNCNANSFTTLILNGGKINQWSNWLHAIEAPAGSSDPYLMKLVTDNLDSQSNAAVQSKVCNPRPGQALYAPRSIAEVPGILQSLMRRKQNYGGNQ